MSEEFCTNYNDGDIVWVKLGPSWWPGEVKDLDKIPSDEIEFKKTPLAVVKFFEEDTYEYVRNWANIHPYNCEKKSDFIKKGMAAFRSKAPHMEKFPKDVATAELKIGGNPNILSDPAFRPEVKRNYVAEVFGTPNTKKKGNKDNKKLRSPSKMSNQKDTAHITHRRFLGLDDYKAYICIQFPGKDRIPGDSEDEEVIRINTEPEQEYNCHSCSYSTKRLEVMILHTKSHIQGVYVSSPKRKRPVTGKPRKKEHSKKQRKPQPNWSDTSSDEAPEPPKEKKRKTKSTSSSKKITQSQPVEEVKPQKPTDIRSDLLAEWEDSDDEFDNSLQQTFETTSGEVNESIDDTAEESKMDESSDVQNETVEETNKIENGDKHLSEIETEPDHQIEEPKTAFKAIVKPTMDKETQEAIKSCFDFEEDEEEELITTAVAAGRKIPRVIPPTEKRKSEILEDIIDLEEGINKEEILKVSQSFNEKSISGSIELESAFKDLMEETSVPKMPEVDNKLKATQNFHYAKTIKFPDKPDESPQKDREKSVADIPTIPINPKKRFVKNFEEFENQLQREEIRRREEEEMKRKMKHLAVASSTPVPDNTSHDDSNDSNIDINALQSTIMSKIIEEANIDQESKDAIMSKIHKKRTPRSKILDSYYGDANNETPRSHRRSLRSSDTANVEKTTDEKPETSTHPSLEDTKNEERAFSIQQIPAELSLESENKEITSHTDSKTKTKESKDSNHDQYSLESICDSTNSEKGDLAIFKETSSVENKSVVHIEESIVEQQLEKSTNKKENLVAPFDSAESNEKGSRKHHRRLRYSSVQSSTITNFKEPDTLVTIKDSYKKDTNKDKVKKAEEPDLTMLTENSQSTEAEKTEVTLDEKLPEKSTSQDESAIDVVDVHLGKHKKGTSRKQAHKKKPSSTAITHDEQKTLIKDLDNTNKESTHLCETEESQLTPTDILSDVQEETLVLVEENNQETKTSKKRKNKRSVTSTVPKYHDISEEVIHPEASRITDTNKEEIVPKKRKKQKHFFVESSSIEKSIGTKKDTVMQSEDLTEINLDEMSGKSHRNKTDSLETSIIKNIEIDKQEESTHREESQPHNIKRETFRKTRRNQRSLSLETTNIDKFNDRNKKLSGAVDSGKNKDPSLEINQTENLDKQQETDYFLSNTNRDETLFKTRGTKRDSLLESSTIDKEEKEETDLYSGFYIRDNKKDSKTFRKTRKNERNSTSEESSSIDKSNEKIQNKEHVESSGTSDEFNEKEASSKHNIHQEPFDISSTMVHENRTQEILVCSSSETKRKDISSEIVNIEKFDKEKEIVPEQVTKGEQTTTRKTRRSQRSSQSSIVDDRNQEIISPLIPNVNDINTEVPTSSKDQSPEITSIKTSEDTNKIETTQKACKNQQDSISESDQIRKSDERQEELTIFSTDIRHTDLQKEETSSRKSPTQQRDSLLETDGIEKPYARTGIIIFPKDEHSSGLQKHGTSSRRSRWDQKYSLSESIIKEKPKERKEVILPKDSNYSDSQKQETSPRKSRWDQRYPLSESTSKEKFEERKANLPKDTHCSESQKQEINTCKETNSRKSRRNQTESLETSRIDEETIEATTPLEDIIVPKDAQYSDPRKQEKSTRQTRSQRDSLSESISIYKYEEKKEVILPGDTYSSDSQRQGTTSRKSRKNQRKSLSEISKIDEETIFSLDIPSSDVKTEETSSHKTRKSSLSDSSSIETSDEKREATRPKDTRDIDPQKEETEGKSRRNQKETSKSTKIHEEIEVTDLSDPNKGESSFRKTRSSKKDSTLESSDLKEATILTDDVHLNDLKKEVTSSRKTRKSHRGSSVETIDFSDVKQPTVHSEGPSKAHKEEIASDEQHSSKQSSSSETSNIQNVCDQTQEPRVDSATVDTSKEKISFSKKHRNFRHSSEKDIFEESADKETTSSVLQQTLLISSLNTANLTPITDTEKSTVLQTVDLGSTESSEFQQIEKNKMVSNDKNPPYSVSELGDTTKTNVNVEEALAQDDTNETLKVPFKKSRWPRRMSHPKKYRTSFEQENIQVETPTSEIVKTINEQDIQTSEGCIKDFSGDTFTENKEIDTKMEKTSVEIISETKIDALSDVHSPAANNDKTAEEILTQNVNSEDCIKKCPVEVPENEYITEVLEKPDAEEYTLETTKTMPTELSTANVSEKTTEVLTDCQTLDDKFAQKTIEETLQQFEITITSDRGVDNTLPETANKEQPPDKEVTEIKTNDETIVGAVTGKNIEEEPILEVLMGNAESNDTPVENETSEKHLEEKTTEVIHSEPESTDVADAEATTNNPFIQTDEIIAGNTIDSERPSVEISENKTSKDSNDKFKAILIESSCEKDLSDIKVQESDQFDSEYFLINGKKEAKNKGEEKETTNKTISSDIGSDVIHTDISDKLDTISEFNILYSTKSADFAVGNTSSVLPDDAIYEPTTKYKRKRCRKRSSKYSYKKQRKSTEEISEDDHVEVLDIDRKVEESGQEDQDQQEVEHTEHLENDNILEPVGEETIFEVTIEHESSKFESTHHAHATDSTQSLHIEEIVKEPEVAEGPLIAEESKKLKLKQEFQIEPAQETQSVNIEEVCEEPEPNTVSLVEQTTISEKPVVTEEATNQEQTVAEKQVERIVVEGLESRTQVADEPHLVISEEQIVVNELKSSKELLIEKTETVNTESAVTDESLVIEETESLTTHKNIVLKEPVEAQAEIILEKPIVTEKSVVTEQPVISETLVAEQSVATNEEELKKNQEATNKEHVTDTYMFTKSFSPTQEITTINSKDFENHSFRKSENMLKSLCKYPETTNNSVSSGYSSQNSFETKLESKKNINFGDMDDEDEKLTDLVSDIVQKLNQDECDKNQEDLDIELEEEMVDRIVEKQKIDKSCTELESNPLKNNVATSTKQDVSDEPIKNENVNSLAKDCNSGNKEDEVKSDVKEVEILCASNSDDTIKFSIQTNLTNLSRSEEISAIALATLSEIKTDLETSSTTSNLSADISSDPDIRFPEKLSDTEMVAIEGNLTVMSEKDLADAQVEITTDKVISSKKPVMLSSFSMDFSDSTSDSGSVNDTSSESSTKLTDFDSKGTEFTSRAITKELKPRVSTKRINAYDQCELLDILEGNNDSEKKVVEFQTPTKSFTGDICDFEEHIPSQIVCTKQFKQDLDDEFKKDKSSVISTTSKLLERLNEIKTDSKKEPTADLQLKNLKPKPKSKPIILSEQIIKPASDPKKIIPPSNTVNDIEDVEAFIIRKDIKKSVETEEKAISPVKTPVKKSRAKPTGKAKILQQTIITPAGEIIQPGGVLPKKKTILVNAPVSSVVTRISADAASSIVTNKTSKPIATVTPSINAETNNQDDNDFDIFNMPIVLSDQILTPENIESMPIVIDSNSASNKSTKPTLLATSSTKLPAGKIVTKIVTTASSTLVTTKAQNVISTKLTKPRILPTVTTKPGMSLPAGILPRTAKPGKYILVSQGASSATPQKYLTKKTVVKRTSLPAALASKVTGAPEGTGNKVMVVTNQQGQQQRLLLTPAQQKVLGYQSPVGPKLAKTVVKTNILQKNLLTPVTKSEATTSTLIGQKIITTTSQVITGMPTSRTIKPIPKRVSPGQKVTPAGKTAKTILITNKHGQTIKKIATTEDDLDKQVAEQLEAIKASSGMQFGTSSKPEPISTRPLQKLPIRRPYLKKQEPKLKIAPSVTKSESIGNPPPLVSTSKKTVSIASEPKKIVQEEAKPQVDRPLNQLVIQDALGNQTTITEGQILALPSETVDGQPQSYMLVTLDQSGNLTPLNNEALMSLDPNLGLGGDLSNMVLQIDQGALGSGSIDQPVPLAQPATVKISNPGEQLQAGTSKIEIPRATVPLSLPVASDTVNTDQKVEQTIMVTPTEASVNIESIVSNSNGEQGQQLIVTGDPIATQKFLESLTEGTTDLANIIANAEGKSILIQADGQQILINTNSDNQMLANVAESTEGGGNPIFATQPNKNTDILAAALADTDVFTSQPKIASQLSPNNALYPINVGNVLETSLTLSSPIMTPLEVPSTNNKKIPDDETDILTQVPKNVDLPITITDPNISQTVANQQVATLMGNEFQTNLELGLTITETTIPSVSTGLTSPGYNYSLPTLDESDISHKPFNSSMPLLNDDVEVATLDKKSGKDDDKTDHNLNAEGFLEEESRFTLGGGMCSSLSEPPPEMFDIPDVNSFGEKNGNNIPLSLQSTPDPKDDDTTDVSIQAESSSEGSCEIPLQPKIVAKSADLSEVSEI